MGGAAEGDRTGEQVGMGLSYELTSLAIIRMANRALLVLAAKLEGREEGAPLSVQGQVNTLIQRAMDPANLCAVFEGWAAWC